MKMKKGMILQKITMLLTSLLFLILLASGCENQVKKEAKLAVTDGQELYTAYCQVCHGANGRGNGPMADRLSIPPLDLTLIEERRGEFPEEIIYRIIDGRERASGHGINEMPQWGDVFVATEEMNKEKRTAEKISHLVSYIKTLQRKS